MRKEIPKITTAGIESGSLAKPHLKGRNRPINALGSFIFSIVLFKLHF